MNHETIEWIAQNKDTWFAICRARGKAFAGDEVMEAFEMLHQKAKQNPDFSTVFTVFLTVYENELPFFAPAKKAVNRTRGIIWNSDKGYSKNIHHSA